MSEQLAICTVAIIAVTSFFSLLGFRDPVFRDRYIFSVHDVLVEKQYRRLLTSSLLHADWSHLLLNMVSLYLFGRHIEEFLGIGSLLLIYSIAVLGGSLLSLWIHRNHEYRALGASGGVCGVIFGYILLFPDSGIYVFPLPVPIPSWLYAAMFLIGSFLALKRQADNIGHDAHLGGALLGLWTTAILEPTIVREHTQLFLTISILFLLAFVYLLKNPMFLSDSSWLTTRFQRSAKPSRIPPSRSEELELDAVLEKISKTGIQSLTSEEKSLLTSVSKKYKRRSEVKKPASNLII